MNTLIRAAFNASKYRALISPVKTSFQPLARSLAIMGAANPTMPQIDAKPKNWLYQSKHYAHNVAAERELVEFLTEEILNERKAQKSKTLPTEIDGFNIQLNGAEVTFTKQANNEKIKITFNVNDSVDNDIEPQIDTNAEKPELGELKSKPSFRVEIVRDNTTLNLLCSFVDAHDENEPDYNDLFGIDEISIYDGEWNEKIYAVAGDVVDDYLYDLILNYLDEKGITNEFVEKLSEFSTTYEHSAYIGLLEGLSKFASGK